MGPDEADCVGIWVTEAVAANGNLATSVSTIGAPVEKAGDWTTGAADFASTAAGLVSERLSSVSRVFEACFTASARIVPRSLFSAFSRAPVGVSRFAGCPV
ncbi:hypothetical protein AB4144_49525, partial [Rhizobiaceae sp. 2RAB30]